MGHLGGGDGAPKVEREGGNVTGSCLGTHR